MGRPIRLAAHPHLAALAMLMALIAALAGIRVGAEAQPITIASAEPRANDVLTDAPATVTIVFSTPLDTATSSVRLLGRDGRALPGISIGWTAPDTASLTVPPDLGHGSWLVAWDVTAADRDAEGAGFYGFTVGTDQDVAPVTLPETGFSTSHTATSLSVVGNGLLLAGLSVLVSIWPLWAVALRPSVVTTGTLDRLRGIALASAVAASTGAIIRTAALVEERPGGTVPDRLLATLESSREAQLLMLALVVVFTHGIVLALVSGASGRSDLVPWITTLALPMPVAMLSHASDEPASRFTALVVTWLALLAVSAAAGGTVSLAWLRGVTDPAVSRFGLIVAIALPILAVSGGYLAWLYIGSGAALRTTTYGALALVTIAMALVFAIAIAATLLAHRARAVGRLLIVPAAAGIALAVSIGSLLAFDTARAALTRESTQQEIPFTIAGDRAQLIIAPGAAGANHLRLELDRPSIPQQTTALVTMSLPAQPELGSQTVPLSRVAGGAFEYHGTELVIAGRWNLEVQVTAPGNAVRSASIPLDLIPERAHAELPGVPWRFTDFAGSAGMLMVALGIAGIVIGIAAGRSPLRMESAGLGMAALAIAAILIVQGRLDPILATGGEGGAINPDDLAMITQGETIYETYCLACHGADLRGDGPGVTGMQPPPADFSAPHTMAHDEATLIYWLRNGKQGTTMPAYGDILTDDEIRAVLSYIARQQREMTSAQP